VRRDSSFAVVPGVERLDCLSKFSNIFQEPLGRWRIYVPSTWGRLRDFYRLVCIHVSRKRAEAMLCSRSSKKVKISRRERSFRVDSRETELASKNINLKDLFRDFFINYVCLVTGSLSFVIESTY